MNKCHPSLKEFQKYLEPIPLDVQDHWVRSFGESVTHLLVGLARAQELGAHQMGNRSSAEKRLSFLNKYITDHYIKVGIPWLKQRNTDSIDENRQWQR